MADETSQENIIPINIEEEMKTAYIDYSMSVIVSRALPDVRDGLKPVQRRVLYGMSELGVSHNRPFKKSARIVGEVLGKYHPHGDSSVYETMVRMAQDWVMRYQLVDGQGNFGSMDGDSPAAMRYTEARLTRIAEELMVDIDKNTVDYQPNFDESLQEPTVLPASFPNLLVNGASGIAVGMATSMPPHNMKEVVQGILAYIDNPDITIPDLMTYIQAPDFPTGGTIYGYDGVKEAYEHGRGKVVLRGKAEIEENTKSRDRIIVSELPYMVNKANMISKTAEMIDDGNLDGIADIRDESDKRGLRVVYELSKDAIPQVVLNKLYKYTQLQTSFNVNNVALVNGRPEQLNLKQLIRHYVEHRHDVVVRRTRYELAEAEKRAHILEGLLVAIDNLDAVIQLIRESQTPNEAQESLMEQFELSQVQAKAILDMRLQKLTGLERDKVKEDYQELMEQIRYYRELLNDEGKRMELIKEELNNVQNQYGGERKSDITYSGEEINIEDIIPNEQVLVTVSHHGYIKRTAINEYNRQGRGGKGSKGTTHRSEDFTESLIPANTHNYILFFTEKGKCHWLKVYEIPEGGKNTKGRPIQNILELEKEDRIKTYLTVDNLEDDNYLDNSFIIFCTKRGVIKKTPLRAFSRPRSIGIIAITIQEDDELLEVNLTDGNANIMLGTSYGMAVRFNEQDVRSMGRVSTGVRGIRLSGQADDEVVGMVTVTDPSNANILTVSEKGFGKRSNLDTYRLVKRGGKGVKAMSINEKTGRLIALKSVSEEDDLMIINKSGVLIRMAVNEVKTAGRDTMGVKLIRLKAGDEIAAVAKVRATDEENEADESEKEQAEE
jgi:DNA gyrase subunit A